MMSSKLSLAAKLSIGAVLLVSLTACGGGGGKKITGKELVGAPKEVETVYRANCVSCHGSDLQGRSGPGTNLQQVGARLSKDEIFNQIKNGGGRMGAFKDRITDQEIEGLADWLSGKK